MRRVELKREYFYRSDGNVDVEYRVLHRDPGPAKVGYYPDGAIRFEAYYLNGVRSRRDGPAASGYFGTGETNYREYWYEGVRHRLDGPAVQRWCKRNGEIVLDREEYWVDGRQFTKEEFDKRNEVYEKKV